MRLLTILLLIFISGCSSLESFRSEVGNLLPKSESEQFADKVDEWTDQKAREIVSAFDGGLPVYGEDGIQPIPVDKIDEFYERSNSAIAELESQYKENKTAMKRLHRIKGEVDATASHMSRIQSRINAEIEYYARDFGEAVVQPIQSAQHANYGVTTKDKYCEDNNYVDDRNDYSDHSCNGLAILQRNFFEERPEYETYLGWLQLKKEELNNLSDKIKRQGLSYETRLFMERASAGECSDLERFNFYGDVPMRHEICYANFRADEQSVYQLKGMEVVQSVSGGVILSPSSRRCPNRRVIFVDTDETYPDNHVFQSNGQYACVTGTRDFTSVLGAKKRLTSFKAITDNHRYYFLSVGQNSQ